MSGNLLQAHASCQIQMYLQVRSKYFTCDSSARYSFIHSLIRECTQRGTRTGDCQFIVPAQLVGQLPLSCHKVGQQGTQSGLSPVGGACRTAPPDPLCTWSGSQLPIGAEAWGGGDMLTTTGTGTDTDTAGHVAKKAAAASVKNATTTNVAQPKGQQSPQCNVQRAAMRCNCNDCLCNVQWATCNKFQFQFLLSSPPPTPSLRFNWQQQTSRGGNATHPHTATHTHWHTYNLEIISVRFPQLIRTMQPQHQPQQLREWDWNSVWLGFWDRVWVPGLGMGSGLHRRRALALGCGGAKVQMILGLA